MKILVTGAAGFIGMHLSKKLLTMNHSVVGIDNINDYYDTNLKKNRLKFLKSFSNQFIFHKLDINNKKAIDNCFDKYNFDVVINLAAQAGVRYSISNPDKYISSNISGFLNILEGCRQFKIKHLIFASSSSVYGMNQKLPFSEKETTDHPVSLYGATKKANELMAHSYSSLYKLKVTGLRFFTVYGPWGRPDMAPIIFTKSILEGKVIRVFNKGNMKRDFTYIDDVTDNIEKILYLKTNLVKNINAINSSNSFSDYRVFNIGNEKSVNLMDFISILEKKLNKKAELKFVEMQNGDVQDTFSDNSLLKSEIGSCSRVDIEEGLNYLIDWYKYYYNSKKVV